MIGRHEAVRAAAPREVARRRVEAELSARDEPTRREGRVPALANVTVERHVESLGREVDHAAWVTIQIGCDNSCAFCIVPSVRGSEVSRRMGDIVHEVESLVAGLSLPCFESLGFVGTYRGKQTGAGRKSVTMRLVFRAADRTLKREDADAAMHSLAEALKARLGAEIRS